MRRQQGYILFVVLIFMQLFALLGLNALNQLFWVKKVQNEQNQRWFLLSQAEHLLYQVAATLKEQKAACLLAPLSFNQLKEHPFSWWTANACSVSGHLFKAYYLLEFLGVDPCATIRASLQAVAAYYRITVLLVGESHETLQVMLQATVSAATQTAEHCDSEAHSVDLGPQSWHELII
jgi:Tfp pilus assembly protein PilX